MAGTRRCHLRLSALLFFNLINPLIAAVYGFLNFKNPLMPAVRSQKPSQNTEWSGWLKMHITSAPAQPKH